jgi:hypothetical protein
MMVVAMIKPLGSLIPVPAGLAESEANELLPTVRFTIASAPSPKCSLLALLAPVR